MSHIKYDEMSVLRRQIQEGEQLSEMVKRIIVKWNAHSPPPKFQLIDEARDQWTIKIWSLDKVTYPLNWSLKARIIQFPKIGNGQFGEVIQARVKPLADESRIAKMNSSLPESPYEGPIAMKMVKSSASNSAHDQFLEEASICAIFEHENVCKLIGMILGQSLINTHFIS